MSPPKIPQIILQQLLELCTKQSPFRCPSGQLYLQIEGVAMGSPLGPTFANFYMGNLEHETFQKTEKPIVYCRYIDDIFVLVKNENEILQLKNSFESNSIL